MKELNYIDYAIQLPDGIPSNILVMLDRLEYYNKEGDSVLYWDRLDDLIVLGKNAIAAGVLSEKNWDTIMKKFWDRAELDIQTE